MDESVNALRETANTLAQAAGALSATSEGAPQAGAFLSLGQISFGALMGSLLTFFVQRWFTKKDERSLAKHRRREMAVQLHERFNSAEMLKARTNAEMHLLEHVGKRLHDIRDTGTLSGWSLESTS